MKRYHFNSIPSTHQYARQKIEDFMAPITVITADFQTHGIGTKGSTWHSVKSSSILATIIYNTPIHQVQPFLSNLFSLAIMESLSFIKEEIRFKPPNDLMINKKKFAGVITHIVGDKTITSFGLNVNQTTEDYMARLDQHG